MPGKGPEVIVAQNGNKHQNGGVRGTRRWPGTWGSVSECQSGEAEEIKVGAGERMTSEETEDAGAGLKPGRRANWLALRRRAWRPYLEQRGENVEGVDGAGAVRVAHELVDVAAPGLLGVVAGRGLKGGQDGREKGRGRGRDAPLAFSKAAKKGHDHVRRRRPSPRGRGSPACPVPPAQVALGTQLPLRVSGIPF